MSIPDSQSSVTLWIQRLKDGEQEAVTNLWDRYFERMVRLAKRKLGNAEKRVADEEDLAATVFHALCDGAANGRFNGLRNREDLWMLLVAITGHKAVDQVRRQTSLKRGGGRVRGNSLFQKDDALIGSFDDLIAGDPDPELLVSMDEQCQHLVGLLRDDVQKEIVRHKLAGHVNGEIAKRVGISLRSVERKLEVIRETWLKSLE
ncbi:MAG: ECF-type sigma factor [Planctomycetota bacterium]